MKNSNFRLLKPYFLKVTLVENQQNRDPNLITLFEDKLKNRK